jgi:hypothetical protein
MKKVLACVVILVLAQAAEKSAIPQKANLRLPAKSVELYEAVIQFQIKT